VWETPDEVNRVILFVFTYFAQDDSKKNARILVDLCAFFTSAQNLTRYGEIMYDNSAIHLNISLPKFFEGFQLNFAPGLCTNMCWV